MNIQHKERNTMVKGITIKQSEKELYRIFKEVERYGRAIFNYPDRTKQESINRSIGWRIKPYIQQGLIFPVVTHPRYRFSILAIPPDVKLIEKKTKKGIKFYPERKHRRKNLDTR